MLRILHAGDLHLDSAFSAFLPHAAARRRACQCEAFEALLEEARALGVSLVLLAGDCFDTVMPNPDTVRRFFSALEKTGVPVVIAPGNHDFYTKGGFWDSMPLPPNVYLFNEAQLGYFSFPALGVAVYGYAFTAESMAAPPLPREAVAPDGMTHILLAHSDMTGASAYAPLSAVALAAAGFDYAALGHIHKPMPLCRYGRTLAAYSGFLAGRGFDEPGVGGAQLVSIDAGRVSVAPLKSNAPVFLVHELDVEGAENGEAVRARVAQEIAALSPTPDTALRLCLVGQVASACIPDKASLLRLGEGLALFEVKDQTVPLLDTAFLQKDQGLFGAFYRALLPRLQSENEAERALAAEALRLGFAALSGRELL